MNFSPKISIIIPVYNGSNFIREAIDSALAQTYKNIEIIVVNDGSNDEGATRKIALSYQDKLRYFEKENGGVASALNAGINEMQGDYFSWLSHDDSYTPDKIEKQIDLLKNINKRDLVVFSDWLAIDEFGNELGRCNLSFIDPRQMQYHLLLNQSIHGCTLLIPKKAFKKCGHFPEEFPTTQDYTLWLRLCEKFKFIHCDETLVISRRHKAQGCLSKQHSIEIHEMFRRELKRMNKKKICKMFSRKDRFKACFDLAKSLTQKGYFDCAHMFVFQIITMFHGEERKLLLSQINCSELEALDNYQILFSNLRKLFNKALNCIIK